MLRSGSFGRALTVVVVVELPGMRAFDAEAEAGGLQLRDRDEDVA